MVEEVFGFFSVIVEVEVWEEILDVVRELEGYLIVMVYVIEEDL